MQWSQPALSEANFQPHRCRAATWRKCPCLIITSQQRQEPHQPSTFALVGDDKGSGAQLLLLCSNGSPGSQVVSVWANLMHFPFSLSLNFIFNSTNTSYVPREDAKVLWGWSWLEVGDGCWHWEQARLPTLPQHPAHLPHAPTGPPTFCLSYFVLKELNFLTISSFFWLHHATCQILSFPTRDQTCALYSGSMES